MATYNPKSKYQWSNDDVFQISGANFGLMINAFRSILNTELAASIFMAAKANDAIEGMMKEYVEKDVIKEVVAEDKQPLKIVK